MNDFKFKVTMSPSYLNAFGAKTRIAILSMLALLMFPSLQGHAQTPGPFVIDAASSPLPDQNGLYVRNPRNGPNENAVVSTRVNGPSGGDPIVSWDVAGVAGWAMGMDNSDDRKLKINPAWDNLNTLPFPPFNPSTLVTFTLGVFDSPTQSYTPGKMGLGTENPIAKLDVRGDNILISPDPSSSLSKFAAMGQSGGACNLFGFRAQSDFNNFINVGIENDVQPVISWNTGQSLDFKCNGGPGCGTVLQHFTCGGAFTVQTNGSGMFSGGIYTPADRRMMSNITEISAPMERLQNLRAVQFAFDTESYSDYRFPAALQSGLIAEEVKQVIPEAVQTSDDGMEMVNYSAIVPVLVEGVKELDNRSAADLVLIEDQARRIEALEEEVKELRTLQQEIEALKQLLGATNPSLKGAEGSLSFSELLPAPRLDQNQPNPFDNSTRITYFVPENTQRALIRVTSTTGNVLAEYTVSKGNGAIEVPAQSFAKGTYAYSLIVDGSAVASRRMVIVR